MARTAELYENPQGWRYRVKEDDTIVATSVLYPDFYEVISALHAQHQLVVITKVDPLPGQVRIP